jgi:two-component system cell cycle sensor histidine kinase/response regulator CckA
MENQILRPRKAATILVLEDDRALRLLCKAILEQAGYKVLAAEDAGEAAAHATKESIDLLLADILLPGLSGPEFARELRGKNPGVKILFVTGSEEPVVLQTLDLVEKQRFLHKPYNPESILAAVRETLEEQ